ncbi:hypothetical protein [Nostoc sp. DedQUE07]|uniref:hypothetical protein n=1 Tax=Nostoc sp. DedQUE07 TaxID=3075392 RepID=UPI002AD38531|nr:hypothetical protein [Nostoc sp. DedQUE07]MDZ8131887.1 hypothetical protein [Nostoc sp. DedQUE07]
MKVFQITQADIDISSTLEPDDLGKWCYIVQGTFQGFFSTEEAAIASYEYVFGRHG